MRISKFANYIKLEGPVDSLEGREGLQRALNKSEGRAITNYEKFNKKGVLDSAPGTVHPWISTQTGE